MEKTSTWELIAVSGAAGEEKVLTGKGLEKGSQN